MTGLLLTAGGILGQEAMTETPVIYPTFTPTHTPTATPTLVATIESLENTVTTYFSASNETPLTGQPFTVTLTIELPKGATLTEAPQFSDPWEGFMLREVGELANETTRDKTIYTQDLTVILWRPGYYRTPETFIGYTFGVVQETLRIPVRPVFIDVPTVLDSQDYNLRPFKPLVYLPYLSPIVVIGVVAVSAGMLRAVMVWYKRRPQKTELVIPPQPIELVTDALSGLKNSDFSGADIVQQTTDHLRRYLQARFDIPAPDLTSEELTIALQSLLPEKLLNELQRLFNEADLIKFANTQPDITFAQRLVEVALRWVSAAEKFVDRERVQ